MCKKQRVRTCWHDVKEYAESTAILLVLGVEVLAISLLWCVVDKLVGVAAAHPVLSCAGDRLKGFRASG